MADRDTINIELPASRFQPPLPLVTSFTRSSFHMFNFGKHRCHPNPNQPNPPQDTLTHSMVMSSLRGCAPVKLLHFIAYASHRTKLHSSVTFAALVLLQRLKACFPTARGSLGHHLFISAFSWCG
ncbi:uncharacterized protein HD556DRAFT_1441027 [Suillus plorans]|uniref:Uncharacterized protein n=1 Tax=Suillus plorans TaxID=116603 RepID=A0A9P7IYT4_9AGAM|nr:uncharacterized protein HD556DRAFT_1441027 [Suillus plorans]KAG1797466.1 hypothetical protein HD556DRAFT_1441027 [Suillus plorans]